MKIGKMIKKLRRENNMTQEALAEKLNISVSAVSQWEIEKTLPDISMIPLLMDIFSVSSDELIGINDEEIDNKVAEAIEKANELYLKWKHKEWLALTEQLYKDYPNRLDVMSAYAFALYNLSTDAQGYNKCIEIDMKILDRSLDDRQRFDAIRRLCHCYDGIDNKEMAMYYAKKLPELPHYCGNYVIEQLELLPDNEKTLHYQNNAESFLWLLTESMFDIADPNYTNPNCKLSVEERVQILQQIIEIIKILYGDNLRDKYYSLYEYYRIIGALYLFGKEYDTAIDNFEIAYEYADKFAISYQDGDKHTSIVFNGFEVQPHSQWKHGKINGFHDLYYRFIHQERYKAIENNSRFVALKEKLVKKIKS